MGLKQKPIPKAINTIDHRSGSKSKRKNTNFSTPGGAKNRGQALDEDILEVFTLRDELSLQQVERIIDQATVITCGVFDQIGRSFRKLKASQYVCGWCGPAGKRAFAGSRD